PAALIFIGLGMLLGSLCTENQVPGFGSILITGTSLFSGAWMDLKAVGGIFAGIGYALPFAHAIDATRAVVKGAGFGGIMTDLYWVYSYAVVLSGLGVAAFAWRTRR
ncbi:MAG: ABC transporter permease, partial [Bacteroidota bacterium]